MREKIIKIFVDWCEKYKIEDYRINSGHANGYYGEEDVLFYIYESEVPLKICFEKKSVEFVFGEDRELYDGTRIIDDSMIIEFADLCTELRKVLGSYSF